MKIRILDGAMGTTLEEEGHDVSGALWGSEMVASQPEVMSSVHERYVAAGADIIETSTYQMSVAGLLETGYSEEEAKAVMRKAVALAAAAASSTSTSTWTSASSSTGEGTSAREASVALALGPYGATLKPGAEYTGVYPGVYGSENSAEALDALTQWHRDRLRVYADNKETWNSIAYVAFETVPNLLEIVAIRRAMAGVPPKPFWVCMCFPGGAYPGGHAMADVVDRLVRQEDIGIEAGISTRADGVEGRIDLPPARAPIPNGFGINCTNPAYLPSLVTDLTEAVRRGMPPGTEKPAMVVYPDGGAVYDVHSRTWVEAKEPPEQWAENLLAAVRDAPEEVWSEVILGGCCKSSFKEVAALRAVVDAAEGMQG